MHQPAPDLVVAALLETVPESLSHQLGIPIEDGSEVSLFRLLCAALLSGDDVTPETLLRVEEMLTVRNWMTPQNLLESTLEERVIALQSADYIVFDRRENQAHWLGEMAERAMYQYNGDLNNVRRTAYRAPEAERGLIREFRGMEDLQTDWFLREVQVSWWEQYPFLPERALAAARNLGLGTAADEIAPLAPRGELPRLVYALETAERTGIVDRIREQAAQPAGR
jgi:hypothetical protein